MLMIKIKLDWKIVIFLLVIALAIFLRVYNFHDWLFFKMDQARDAFLIEKAFYEGAGGLPLLGPKAGGTDLNLGPAFYYFQYLAATIFQNLNPATLAYPDLLFGILSIPLFFFFLKKYFSRNWSMVLASLYAVCFLGIQYSRFSWNPNSLVFFNLLFFFSLLNIFDDSVRYKLRWVAIAGFSFAVSTQLHFLSFLTLPVITAIFIIFNLKDARNIISWKYILVFAAIVALIYLPVVLNEIVSKGENTNEFLKALKEKPSAHSFWQNVKRDFRYWGQNWFLIFTSHISKKTGYIGSTIVWLGAILPALYLAGNMFRQEAGIKKKFLLLSLLWFFIYFLAYIPIAYQIRPRFFLPMMILPFVLVGYLASYFWEKKKIIWRSAVALGLTIVFAGNLFGTYSWFKEIKAAQKRGVYPKRTIILKARDGIVLWHLERAVEFAKNQCGKKTIYFSSPKEYKYPFKYLFGLNDFRADTLKKYSSKDDEACFLVFGLTRSKKDSLDSELAENFTINHSEKFGALTAYQLELAGDDNIEEKSARELEENRIFWKDVWKDFR